jgi:hypothetical protein
VTVFVATFCNQRGRCGTRLFQHVWPFLHSFYGTTGWLKYSAPDSSVLFVSSEEGTHKGHVWSWSLALFAASKHPTVFDTLDNFPDGVAVLWAATSISLDLFGSQDLQHATFATLSFPSASSSMITRLSLRLNCTRLGSPRFDLRLSCTAHPHWHQDFGRVFTQSILH